MHTTASRNGIGRRFLLLLVGLLCCSLQAPAQQWLSQSSAAASDAVWSRKPYPTTGGLMGIHFVDEMHGWIIDSDRGVLATTDGGMTWSLKYSNNGNGGKDLSFVDAMHGWVAGFAGGYVIATADGGANWAKQTVPLFQENADAVHFVDTMHGWVLGEYGSIVATTDGGATWKLQRSSLGQLIAVDFVDTMHGWAVGIRGTILSTTDGGATWTPRVSETTLFLNDVDFVDTMRGWVVGKWGLILVTDDGGVTWKAQTEVIPDGPDLRGIDFVDPRNGWAVGDGGTIVATSDGGATWKGQSSETTNNLRGVVMLNAESGWAVGGLGLLLRYGPPTTSGVPWVEQRGLATSVVPNPVTGGGAELRVDEAPEGEVEIEVIDAMGNSVWCMEHSADGVRDATRLTLPTAGLPAGAYLVRVRCGSYQRVERMIVAR